MQKKNEERQKDIVSSFLTPRLLAPSTEGDIGAIFARTLL